MTILVSACGSSIGLEVARSLKMAGSDQRVIGSEVSWWGKQLGERFCDEVFLLPRGDEPGYVEALEQILQDQQVQLLLVNTDTELEAIEPVHDQLQVPASFPAGEALRICLDKQLLHEKLSGEQLVARTCPVSDGSQLEQALEEVGRPGWLRCSTGPRGRGSILIESADEGAAWIDYWRRRGGDEDQWLLHQYLPGRNFNWTSIWWQGELVVSAAGERLAYFLSQVAVSGITGNVSHARTVVDERLNETASRAVRAMDAEPHGVYSVDLREASEGVPLVTEINARQAFRPLLYTHSGVNFSALLADLVVHGKRPDLPAMNAQVAGMEIIRGMDFEPLVRGPA
jgi:carbamoyl-phosphate synthase large subunit